MGSLHPRLFIPSLFLVLTIPVMVRRYFVIPRIGQFKIGTDRKAASQKAMITLVVIILCYLVIITFPGLLRFIPGKFTILGISGFYILIILSVIAFLSECRRLYMYAVIWFGGHLFYSVAEEYFGIGFGKFVVFGAPGVIILTVGLILFVRFLRRYPLPSEGSE